MIDSNQIAVIMSVIKAVNVQRKLKNKWTLSDQQIKDIESKLLNIANKINKVINWFVNNSVVLKLKDASYKFRGTEYPEYIYMDEEALYFTGMSMTAVDGGTDVQIQMTSSPNHATDVSKLNFWQKRKIINYISKTYLLQTGKQGIFRIKRIITYT